MAMVCFGVLGRRKRGSHVKRGDHIGLRSRGARGN